MFLRCCWSYSKLISTFQKPIIFHQKAYKFAFFRNQHIWGKLMNISLNYLFFFTIFISHEVFCICFFVFTIKKLIVYHCFFNIYIDCNECFPRMMKLHLQSQRHQILRISQSFLSYLTQSSLLYHTKIVFFNSIEK